MSESYTEFRCRLIAQNRPLTEIEKEKMIQYLQKGTEIGLIITVKNKLEEIQVHRLLNFVELSEMQSVAYIRRTRTFQKAENSCCVVF